ncbi:unnamed protein product [Paramecium pentaurelia]|uniref:Uncharacterized protein n=1 Tax=Paramecium pentaurelia TaxID=43138 RepID=A0A8S1Y8A1_9CILI|nr:unnamed protein product [Paramecium pentaurelia]
MLTSIFPPQTCNANHIPYFYNRKGSSYPTRDEEEKKLQKRNNSIFWNSFIYRNQNPVKNFQMLLQSWEISLLLRKGFLSMNQNFQYPLKLYSLYYFFENFGTTNFLIQKGYQVKQIINQHVNGYNKQSASQNQLIHFCCINLLLGLVSYRPRIYGAKIGQKLNKLELIDFLP